MLRKLLFSTDKISLGDTIWIGKFIELFGIKEWLRFGFLVFGFEVTLNSLLSFFLTLEVCFLYCSLPGPFFIIFLSIVGELKLVTFSVLEIVGVVAGNVKFGTFLTGSAKKCGEFINCWFN